jgi:hypothetical protein
MMLNDELAGFDGESAVPFINIDLSTGDSISSKSSFMKHRAIGAFLHDSPVSLTRSEEEDPSFCTLSLPSKQPLSKIELETSLSASTSSRKRSQASSSRCSEKPLFIQKNTSFYLQQVDYDLIKNSVEKALQSVENDYDWNYFEKNDQNEHMVRLPSCLSLSFC